MKRANALLYGAWAIYLLAWFLPVHAEGDRLPGALPGMQALRISLAPIWPDAGKKIDLGGWSILMVLSGVTNLLVVISVGALVGRAARLFHVIGWASAFAVLLNAHWLFAVFHRDIGGVDLRIGYYLWWLSFLPLAAGSFVMGRECEGSRLNPASQ